MLCLLLCRDCIVFFVELCPSVHHVIAVSQIQTLGVWMSLFLHNFSGTMVAVSARWRPPPSGFSRSNFWDVWYTGNKYWGVLYNFFTFFCFFPTIPPCLHPFIPNALSISYHHCNWNWCNEGKKNTGTIIQKNIWHCACPMAQVFDCWIPEILLHFCSWTHYKYLHDSNWVCSKCLFSVQWINNLEHFHPSF